MSIAVGQDEFEVWSRFIHQISGVYLDPSKRYLLETRLRRLLEDTGAAGFTDLLQRVQRDGSNRLRRQVISAMTTNETSFFRDLAPFELIQYKLLPDLVDRRRQAGLRPLPIRIWSAGCSTGQEAYSLAIAVREALGTLDGVEPRILATDISEAAIAQANAGFYTRLQLDRGMPPERVARYFTREGEGWRVRDEVRSLLTFRTMNLLEPLAFPAPFDLVLCRNVAIYFSDADRARLFRNLARVLATDGYLMIGGTESLAGLESGLEAKQYLRTVFYQRQGDPRPNAVLPEKAW